MGRKKKNKTEPVVSSTDEEKEEIVKETSGIEFACPMCKKILEMKNELEIKIIKIANARVYQQVSN